MSTDLDDLLAPVRQDEFFADHLGRAPLHIPAQGAGQRRRLLDWASFNGLLNQQGVWTAHNLRVVRDGVAVFPTEYCQEKRTASGPVLRPSSRKLEVLLAEGSSLVANEVHALHPPIAKIAALLGQTFAADVGANVYCSFGGVQAFGTHYDVHDVFAVQTEGEKVWRIYGNQIERPVDLPPDTPETRQWLQESRGPVVAEVRMKPGDLLYLPRGRYHDALAVDGASLHVTFSVTPLHGKSVFSLLERAAMQLPAFRAYLPPAGQDGGRALAGHLARLGPLLSGLVASPAFADEVAMAQEQLVLRPARFDLPARSDLIAYAPTGSPFPKGSTAVGVAYEWCSLQQRFALADLIARFDFIREADIIEAVAVAERAGALVRAPTGGPP